VIEILRRPQTKRTNIMLHVKHCQSSGHSSSLPGLLGSTQAAEKPWERGWWTFY
jgi:hypothetical protein